MNSTVKSLLLLFVILDPKKKKKVPGKVRDEITSAWNRLGFSAIAHRFIILFMDP